jgi:hypothetical protein
MNPTRAELLKMLDVFSRLYPDMRLGQLIVNLSNWGTNKLDWVYDVEDEELLAGGSGHLERRGYSFETLAAQAAANTLAPHPSCETATR